MNEIRILGENETVSLPESLLSSIGYVGLDSWMFFTKKVYKFPVYRIVSQSGEQVNGWLALVHVKHPIFGNYLTTSPFGSYGGFAFASGNVRDGLLEKAEQLANSLKVKYCVVRFLDGNYVPPKRWSQSPIYSTYMIHIPEDVNELWSRFVSKDRWKVKQALKKGFHIEFGTSKLLDSVHEILTRSMHELGSPYHSKSYLRTMVESLDENIEFAIVRNSNDLLVAAAVLVYDNGTVSNVHANSLRDFRSDYASEFLYWSLFDHYCRKGVRICDLGRSLNGSGNEVYKMKWKPDKVPLAYWYYMPGGGGIPELNQKSARFQFAIQVWRTLPYFIVRLLGPSIIRGIT